LPPSTSATHEYRLDRATNKNDHSHDPQRCRAVADVRSETPAGFGSEQVAGFILECMTGFVGIRIWDEIREKIFKNYALKSMDSVNDKLEEAAIYIERNRKLSLPSLISSSHPDMEMV
jgi:hypothetical protein